jgi:hypothetical protein
MRDFETVVVVIAGLFAVGTVMGLLLVALPLFKSVHRRRRDRRYLEGGGRWEQPVTRDDEAPHKRA